MFFTDFLKQLMWYIIALIIVFFGVPLISFVLPADMVSAIASGVELTDGMTLAGVASSFMYYFSFEFVNPIAVGICSVIFTLKNEFKWYFPLVVGALFLPMMLVYFQVAGWYCIEYIGMSYCACGAGHIINKIRERNM